MEAKEQKTVIIQVQGNCPMCKTRIENAAKEISGVSSANWDQNTKQLHLSFDESDTSVEMISKAIAKAGHDTDKYEADIATYAALPNCCKYRK
ncbi:heavy-metal-associated domain-containing protein [Dysgonomonas sp. ZJ709]|uniref:heavy-metal-associated domain-containing protein n=1 Tax=Dysgonomonas sp. ZJ709 TaxID=2709797 RepID=UPI0013E9D8A4|nr:cation transporter [Dysgonomonas sp. ZJ709]